MSGERALAGSRPAYRVLRAALVGALALVCVAACLHFRPAGSVDLESSPPANTPASGGSLDGKSVEAAKGRVARLHHELDGIEQKFAKQVPPHARSTPGAWRLVHG